MWGNGRVHAKDVRTMDGHDGLAHRYCDQPSVSENPMDGTMGFKRDRRPETRGVEHIPCAIHSEK